MTGTFPLNVQAGSPKFYISAVGNKNVGDYITVPTVAVSVPNGYSVIGNACYTIMQDGDQDSWMTFYMPPIEDTMGTNVDVVIISAGANNNFSTTGNSTYMQCVWSKEYYESITTSISTVNNEIDTLTPKVDNSFVSATKTNDTTLRLTRNDGTTVDISFPKGISVRTENLTSYKNITSNTNELVIITGSINLRELNNHYLYITGLGHFQIASEDVGTIKRVIAEFSGDVWYTNLPSKTANVSGLLYNGGKLTIK